MIWNTIMQSFIRMKIEHDEHGNIYPTRLEIANSVTLLKKLYPKIKWKEGRLCNDNIKQAEDWARQIIK